MLEPKYKLKNTINRLKIRPINYLTKPKIQLLSNNFSLISLNKKSYSVTVINLDYQKKNDISGISIQNKNFKADVSFNQALLPYHFRNHLNYGNNDSFIVDMQGISSLLYARSKVFSDQTTRAILLELQYLKPKITYLRIGASGSPANKDHPGGEVLEESFIYGNNGSGLSQTKSGYLSKKLLFSKKISLHEPDRETLREERALYSHTAWLTPVKKQQNNNIYLHITITSSNINFLELLDLLVKQYNIKAYALQMFIKPKDDYQALPLIVGRVLKHLPQSPILTLEQAKNIASEQTFPLYSKQAAVFYGTNYHRIEKEWEQFRGGKRYEPFGHIHGMIIANKQRDDQHNLFHLRQLFLTPDTLCHIILTPIKQIIKIEPVSIKKNRITNTITGKQITL
jgi:hypothetical protein